MEQRGIAKGNGEGQGTANECQCFSWKKIEKDAIFIIKIVNQYFCRIKIRIFMFRGIL